jgi:NifU-like protein involved in Fe-S cluster formation
MNNPLGYPDPVWTLFRQLPRSGRLDAAADVQTAVATSAAQGARLQLQVRRDPLGGIQNACFQALGCPYVIATGAWLAQWLTDRRSTEPADEAVATLRAALEIPEDRAHCWLMAQDVLRALKPDVLP